MPHEPSNFYKQACLQIASGGSAGFVEVSIMHPLDLIKTRIQVQSIKNVAQGAEKQIHYEGIVDGFLKIYKQEGIWSFYKGIVPPLLAETPKRAIKFFTFEQYKKFFLFGSEVPTPMTFSLAGMCAGVTEAIFVNPFEVVKVNLQCNRSKSKEQPSTWSITKEIAKKDGLGLKGLNKGLSGTVARNGVFNMVYFGFYHSIKDLVPSNTSEMGKFFSKLSIGFVSGTLASCINIPFDVAKSRIQAPPEKPGELKYKKLFPTMATIAKEEGWKALYKGLVPKIMRLGPGGAIMLVVYDYTYEYLKKYLA